MGNSGGLWRTVADSGGLWRTGADSGGLWRTVADCGGQWRTVEQLLKRRVLNRENPGSNLLVAFWKLLKFV